MSKTPLRSYLDSSGQTAEAFAAAHDFSAWSVRHWTRGDKEPSLGAQIQIEKATDGLVKPADWLAWSIERKAEKDAESPKVPSADGRSPPTKIASTAEPREAA